MLGFAKLLGLTLGFLVYCYIGGLGTRVWDRHRRVRAPESLESAPATWLAYWLPYMIVLEVVSLGGLALMYLVAVLATPSVVLTITFGACWVLVTLTAVLIDIIMVLLVRRKLRWQRTGAGGNRDQM
jgi:hypothetical protein